MNGARKLQLDPTNHCWQSTPAGRTRGLKIFQTALSNSLLACKQCDFASSWKSNLKTHSAETNAASVTSWLKQIVLSNHLQSLLANYNVTYLVSALPDLKGRHGRCVFIFSGDIDSIVQSLSPDYVKIVYHTLYGHRTN